MSPAPNTLRWFRLHWPVPLTEDVAVRIMRGWATDLRSPVAILETHATGGAVTYRLGAPVTDVSVIKATLTGLCPGVVLVPLDEPREQLQTAGRLKLSTRHRALDVLDLPASSRAVLAAMSRARQTESLLLQVVLGPRRIPLAIPNSSPSSAIQPWWWVAWNGNGQQVDPEKRSALRVKVAEHGFAATVRLAVSAATPERRRSLLLGVLAALRTAEAPNVQLRLKLEPAERAIDAVRPWRWPLRLNLHEVLALTGWPITTAGDDALPGLPSPHPKPLAPGPGGAKANGRVVALATAPGADTDLRLSMADQLHHLHVVGPTGSGKSWLLGSLVLQDAADGRGIVVIDPKADLVNDILERLPPERWDDVVVLDPADTTAPVGFNPLAARPGRRPEVVADALLAVFHQLWADSWGPRTQDILHACLLTLCRRTDASLVMLPLLLTNPGFRRSVTKDAVAADPVALAPFWAWYEHLSDGERAAAIGPVMNKVRAMLLRPSLRAVLGQVRPAFDLAQVFSERKMLLVSLNKGLVGPEAAALLGSLVVAELWQSTLERAAVPSAKRHPVHVVIDELQDYLHLPTDLSDALAQARGLGVGFTLAHQYLDQLPKPMRSAVMANARSRVCFRLPPEDAAVMGRGHRELTADDLAALGKHEVYASLLHQGTSGPYVSGRTYPLGERTGQAAARRSDSRRRYGRAPSVVEAGFASLTDPVIIPDTTTERPGRRRVGGTP